MDNTHEGIKDSADTAVEQMKLLLDDKVAKKEFYLDPGETEDQVLERVEKLHAVIEKLGTLAPMIVSLYREVLHDHDIDVERTGRLSLVVVGGRVHGESELKTWSDVDVVITAEKPFLPKRQRFLNPDEQAALQDPILASRDLKRQMVQRFTEEILPRLSEMVGFDVTEEGILELKGYGHQRIEDTDGGLVICNE